MKKLTFLFICLLCVSAVFAQVTRDKVVVEVGTGTWCQYCPGAAMGVDDLIENGWPVAAIENHNGDIFANQYSNARNTYYGVPGFPTAYFDGGSAVVGGSHSESMYASYWPKVQQRMAVPSPVTIEVWGNHTGQTYNVVVKVAKVSAINGSNIRLHLCVTESNIVYSWQGMSELDYVNRLMVPDQNGTSLNFDDCDVLEIPLTFNIQQTWGLLNLQLVAFVQTNSNKEIHNGYRTNLVFLPPPPPSLAASFVSDTATCATHQVQFTDQSTGDPTNWYWEFPGGTPDTSREQNPVITYNTAGKYDVTLIVQKDCKIDSTLMEDYIDVFELPDVAFAALDDQCINYPPVELTQGTPAGGNYSGPGVENGFFHPDVAGAGTHTLVYTYTDENSCANSAEQTIFVDACTGLPENQGVQIVTLPNPTQGSFKLSVSGMEDIINVRIINITGKTVYQRENIQVNGNYSTAIDLSGNSSGIYYIYVDGDKSSYFRKIILQK
jgi:PKD repeat protein